MNLIRCVRPTGIVRHAPALMVLVATLCSVALASAAEGVLTLDDAVRRALIDAPQLLAAQASVDSARQLAPTAGRLPDPEAIVGIDNLPVNTADAFSLSRDFMTMRKVGVMQSVPSAAKRSSQRNLASREINLAEARVAAGRFEIAKATAEAWIQSAVAARSLEVLRARRQGSRPHPPQQRGHRWQVATAVWAMCWRVKPRSRASTREFSIWSSSWPCDVRNWGVGWATLQREISGCCPGRASWSRSH